MAAIELRFLQMMMERTEIYYIPLGTAMELFGMPEHFVGYLTDSDFKKYFTETYLILLYQSISNHDTISDYIYKTHPYGSYPWFSPLGFKSFCDVLNTDRSLDIKRRFIRSEEVFTEIMKGNLSNNKHMIKNAIYGLIKSHEIDR